MTNPQKIIEYLDSTLTPEQLLAQRLQQIEYNIDKEYQKKSNLLQEMLQMDSGILLKSLKQITHLKMSGYKNFILYQLLEGVKDENNK